MEGQSASTYVNKNPKRRSAEDVSRKPKKIRKYMSQSKLTEICTKFLSDRQYANLLVDILDQFYDTTETPSTCVVAMENVFIMVLKSRDMTVDDKENTSEAENQYKEWLRNCYNDAWGKMSLCLQNGSPECKLQALNSLFKLLSMEAKFPLNKPKKIKKKKNKNSFPVNRLKEILKSLLFSSHLDTDVLNRFSEFAKYQDVYSNIWVAAESLLRDICKEQPNDKNIWNILSLLCELPKLTKGSTIVLCDVKNGIASDTLITAAVDSMWKLLAPWSYSTRTHQLLLIVLVEHLMPKMENAVFLTDFFMDSLSRDECEISMLALQGIFNLVLKYNIEYPDIFGKLYQLYTADALKAKYKTRLYVLTDAFLRSTHLPLVLVAAFAKRFSRLLMVASPPDMLILMTLIVNLLIRHPDLSFLYHNPGGEKVDNDPYLEAEKDPLKSRASDSQLWEVRAMQRHYMDRVCRMAESINKDLPSVEYPLEPLLELTWEKMIRKDVKQLNRIMSKFFEKFPYKPPSSKQEVAVKNKYKLLTSQIKDLINYENTNDKK